MQDYYETLQVHPRADAAAIEAAYSRLHKLYDATRLDGAADELVALAREKRDIIERAYAVLSDPTRRASYDAEQATLRAGNQPFDAAAPLSRVEGQGRQPATDDEAEQSLRQAPSEEMLDYRPLPPAKRAERARGIAEQPARAATTTRKQGRVATRVAPRPWAAPAALVVVVALIVVSSLVLTGGGGPAAVPATPTPSQFDIYETALPQARLAAQQNPSNVQDWVDLGNVLYDSAQVVREGAPDSPLYQQRLGRWLEATNAYSQALALGPDNASVRADMGASSCFYGTGTGDQSFVRKGTAEVQQAAKVAPNDERVLLSLGHCLISAQPPQTADALAAWRKIITQNPSSQIAGQAQLLIAKYGGQ